MDLLFPLAVTLVASFINTLTGFGFALVSMSTFPMAMDAKSAVVLTMLLYTALGPIFLWSARRDVDRPLLGILLLSSFFGLPLGTLVLVAISETLLRLLIGTSIVLVAILLISNYHRPFYHKRRAAVAVGFVTGLLTTSITVSGPLVVLFLANQGVSKERLRATSGAFLLGMMPITLGLFLLTGLVTFPMVMTAVKLMPALILGYLLGIRLLPYVDPGVFRRVTVFLVLAGGATMVVSVLRSLLGM